jgi:hypothetical protein
MPLEVKFAVETPNLRFQEDSVCTWKLTNIGREPLKVSNPSMTPTLPRLKVMNVKSGVEKVFQRPPRPGSIPRIEQNLGPGKSYTHGLNLLDLPVELDPGEYDVSIGCKYNGGAEFAESAPIRVKIRPTTARNLGLEASHLPNFLSAWINMADEAPELVRTGFDLYAGGGARDLRFVAKGSLSASPVISSAQNKQACPHSWFAWIDGPDLRSVHLHDTQGPSPVRSIQLPGGEARIVGPLHTDPTPDSGGRPSGGLLLWLGERDKGESQFQALKLTPEGITAQARNPFPAPKPSWMGSFVRADGKRLALVVQAQALKVTLTLVPWPGVPGAAKKLGEWKGEFMTAGTSMDPADVLHGSLLLRTGMDVENDLERIDFDLDAKDGFTAKPPIRIPNDSEDPVGSAVVRLSESGLVAALFKGPAGWSFYDGQAASPLPEPLKSTSYPLDVVFRDNTTPVLVAAKKEFGFHLYEPSGARLESRFH